MDTPPQLSHGHAVAWKWTWRLAVERELDEMIKVRIIPLLTESMAATSLDSKRLELRQFLRYDLGDWGKGSTQLKEAKEIERIPERKGRKKGSSRPTGSKPVTFTDSFCYPPPILFWKDTTPTKANYYLMLS